MVVKIKDFFKNLWQKIKIAVCTACGAIKKAMCAACSAIKKAMCSAGSAVKKFTVTTANKVKSFFAAVPDSKAVLLIRSLFSKKKDDFSEEESELFDAFNETLTSEEKNIISLENEITGNDSTSEGDSSDLGVKEDPDDGASKEDETHESEESDEDDFEDEATEELTPEEEMIQAVEFIMNSEADSDSDVAKTVIDKKKTIIYFSVSAVLVLIICFFAFTGTGRGAVVNAFTRIAAKMAFSKVQAPSEFQQGGYIEPEEDPLEEEVITVVKVNENETGDSTVENVNTTENPSENPENNQGEATTPVASVTNTPKATPTNTPTPTRCVINVVPKDPNIINVLLIGEENVYGALRGRSDAILIGSFNKKTGAISLVSLFRDSWIELPDYPGVPSDKKYVKLNSAYAYGGAELLLKTVEKNFGISCDSYVIVDFNGFEKIIDILGGVDIEISKTEANYLNKTNYISDKKQRNLVAGVNHMSGNQALGYCRIRRVIAINGEEDDFGRTFRQRTVLNCIFEKFKTANYNTLVKLITQCFELVNAPAEMEKIAAECLKVAISKNLSDFTLNTCTLPTGKNDLGALSRWEEREFVGYDSNGNALYKYQGLGFDAPKNAEYIRKFLYGY